MNLVQIKPNFIPLPIGQVATGPAGTVPVREKGGASSLQPSKAVMPDVDDLYAKGEVVKYYPSLGIGMIKCSSGHEVPFDFKTMRWSENKPNAERLRTGIIVGYDVTRDACGTRVSKIKIYN